VVIARIQKRFFADRASVYGAEKFLKEYEKGLLYSSYVKDAAIELIEKLGGTVTYEREAGLLFWRTMIVVSLAGECPSF
jgi:hypothetical protein